MVNTYVLDPAHIVPSRSDPNSNGHFPINHNLASGTPRGFNLQNLPGMNGLFPFSAGGNGAFPAFNGQGVQVQMNWGADGTGNDNGLHHPGAIRRGSRFPNNRGPYDRRQPRYGNNGRLSPPRGLPAVPMGSMRPSGRQWGDGSAVGPKEAVQGRSLKSYEDLDAVGGAQGGELNY